jgi:hypothetical protein
MSCDCTVAYNGYADFVDEEVLLSKIDNAIKVRKEDLEDWLKQGKGRRDSIYMGKVEFLNSASGKDFLNCSYTLANYCPKCGIKIDWSKYVNKS